MHPAAAKEIFDADVATLTPALAQRRGWVFHTLEFPLIDCSFHLDGRAPLRLQCACDNWNELPPAITLHSIDGTTLTSALSNPTGIFHPSLHPSLNRFFICMRGTREYHTHPSHLADPWESLRDHSNFTLGNILTQIWNGWLKGST